ncbi:pentatricopeptide repeat-containing protein At1g11290, chloroplastic-like [Selaginella moellendorffii]|uniref:pentatricopeptide repeat-containing protein At1g11290, chloroplastic-like n=1 Tax=Selaginella moellendorffii TaxID=88036 RepID=UPI000D1C4F8C|nr:pentatricopeptide repeat-containing protein At1g11290, chloroplastic-like [Selaginella moellendorffii]|eukprot:XP_024544495.1 pentatricopeptide repeat-containing protein At1g11290, chloroplastic-like [Selaginella moellendorffii]
MQNEGVRFNAVTISSVLTACRDIKQARELERLATVAGFGGEERILRSLIHSYGECGSVDDAREVFDAMEAAGDLVSCTALMGAYAQNGNGMEALRLFEKMSLEGVKLDKISFVSIIKEKWTFDQIREPDIVAKTTLMHACACARDLRRGKLCHELLMQTGFDTDLTLQNTLLSMYGKCGMLDELHDMFCIIEAPDAVSYNSIISALGHNSQPRQALFFFRCMLLDGNLPSLITFISVAHACGCIGDPRPAVALCSLIQECSRVTTSDSVLRSAIVAMHGRCGDVEAAREAYESYAKDELSCTSMVAAVRVLLEGEGGGVGELEIDQSQDLAYIPGVQMVMCRAASAKEDIDAFSDAHEWECLEDGDDKPYVCKLENVLAHPLDGVCDQQFFNKAALNQHRIRIHNREIDLENQVHNEVLPRRLENQKLKLLNMKYSHIKDEESRKIKILQDIKTWKKHYTELMLANDNKKQDRRYVLLNMSRSW